MVFSGCQVKMKALKLSDFNRIPLQKNIRTEVEINLQLLLGVILLFYNKFCTELKTARPIYSAFYSRACKVFKVSMLIIYCDTFWKFDK